jgi:hypothetical protein
VNAGTLAVGLGGVISGSVVQINAGSGCHFNTRSTVSSDMRRSFFFGKDVEFIALQTLEHFPRPRQRCRWHPGQTRDFQLNYRDSAAGGSGFNFSDGLRVVFCP